MKYWFICYRPVAGNLHRIWHALWVHLVYLAFFCLSFSFNDLWLVWGLLRFVFAPTHKKNSFVCMTLIPVLCHVSTKISVFALLTCSMLDWHRTLMLYTRDRRRQISLEEASPDYDRSTLEQSTIDFANITSDKDVPQSVKCCCLDTVQLGWRDVDII